MKPSLYAIGVSSHGPGLPDHGLPWVMFTITPNPIGVPSDERADRNQEDESWMIGADSFVIIRG